MIDLTILDNGDLEISVTDEKEFLYEVERFEDLSENEMLYELLEAARYIGNDWYANVYIGLTDSPTIGQGALFNEGEDEGDEAYWENTDYEKAWWYPDYMVKSFLDELVETGKTIFTKAW
jgi:hypothetical protein